MSSPIEYLDILFFALIAVFIFLRLRNVLGQRTHHDEGREHRGLERAQQSETADGRDNVVSFPGAKDLPPLSGGATASIELDDDSGLAKIQAADPGFDPAQFLDGARMAFEMIINAFASGDKATLQPLLSDAVYQGFAQAIDERHSKGESLSTTIVSMDEATMVDARLVDHKAQITVRFKSEQINVVRDADGNEVDTGAAAVETLTDIWTFERDTRSADPNWYLIATRSGE